MKILTYSTKLFSHLHKEFFRLPTGGPGNCRTPSDYTHASVNNSSKNVIPRQTAEH